MASLRSISLVWIVPVIALLVAIAVVGSQRLQRGPVVAVSFASVDGVEAGITPVKYRGVVIGQVRDASLSADQTSAALSLQLTGGEESFATSDARYWIVTPDISWSGISGLSTLASGPYIAAEPGSGKTTTQITGLDAPPESTEGYSSYTLRASSVDDVDQGDPVYVRGATIGRVASIDLNDKGDAIRLTISIDNANSHYVTTKSTFWLDSGITADISTQGLSVQTSSVRRVVRGGISMDSPSGALVAEAGSEFPLLAEQPDSLNPDRDGRRFILTTPLRGSISVGSSVNYRQIEVGKVTAVNLSSTRDHIEVSIRIPAPHYSLVRTSSVFWDAGGIHARASLFSGVKLDIDSLNAVLNGGIEFATPTTEGPRAPADAHFVLSDKEPKDWPDNYGQNTMQKNGKTPAPAKPGK